MVDRYGEAIEADLHRVFGLDLLDFFRGRYSWRKLLALLASLPAASAYGHARAMDRDYARQVMAMPKSEVDSGVPFAEYTPEAAALDTISDLLQAVVERLDVANGQKPARLQPAQRPVTAFELERRAQAAARMASLIDEVTAAQQRWAELHPSP